MKPRHYLSKNYNDSRTPTFYFFEGGRKDKTKQIIIINIINYYY
jgi:hypothetical protein